MHVIIDLSIAREDSSFDISQSISKFVYNIETVQIYYNIIDHAHNERVHTSTFAYLCV